MFFTKLGFLFLIQIIFAQDDDRINCPTFFKKGLFKSILVVPIGEIDFTIDIDSDYLQVLNQDGIIIVVLILLLVISGAIITYIKRKKESEFDNSIY